MAVFLQEQHGRGLTGAQLLQLGLQQLLLGLQLGLAAQRDLQPLQRLLQRLPLAQQLHPAGRQEGGERPDSACSCRGGRQDEGLGAVRGTHSPLPGVGVLLLTLELLLQLADCLLPAQHHLRGHCQVVCHRGQPAAKAGPC